MWEHHQQAAKEQKKSSTVGWVVQLCWSWLSPGKSNLNFPWEKSQSDNTVVKKAKKKQMSHSMEDLPVPWQCAVGDVTLHYRFICSLAVCCWWCYTPLQVYLFLGSVLLVMLHSVTGLPVPLQCAVGDVTLHYRFTCSFAGSVLLVMLHSITDLPVPW